MSITENIHGKFQGILIDEKHVSSFGLGFMEYSLETHI